MTHFGNYEDRVKNFSWSISEQELGYKPGQVINIGWYCSDRICQQGKADKIALIWEGFTGEKKIFTYDDIRLYSNSFAKFITGLGIKAGERICLSWTGCPSFISVFWEFLRPELSSSRCSRLSARSHCSSGWKTPKLSHLHPEEAPFQGQEDKGQAAAAKAHHHC